MKFSIYHVEYLVLSYKLLFSELNSVFYGVIEGLRISIQVNKKSLYKTWHNMAD